MNTKMLPNPVSLANNSPSTSTSTASCSNRSELMMMYNRSSSSCPSLSFRSADELLPWKKSPHRFPLHSVSLFLRFCRQPALGRPYPVGHHPNKSPPPFCCSSDKDDTHRYSSISKVEEEDAIDAVAQLLQEFGASKEDSVDIAQRSPKYLAMLLDSVHDFDLSHWNSWSTRSSGELKPQVQGTSSSSHVPTPVLSLKEKLHYVAKENGDKGMLPFLESLGLSLPYARHLTRSLSPQTLPKLIRKVNYVKEMFFSNSDDNGLIVRNARRMMMHLSVFVDDDVQQTLSFFAKIEARRGGLNMLDSGDSSLSYLLESFPRLLLLSLESSMMSMVGFLGNIGVPRADMRKIFLLFPPIIFYDVEKDIKPRLQAFEKVAASKKDLGKMLLKYPWILSTGIQENYEEILSFFELEKVPKLGVDLAIKSWPLLLGCSVSKLKVMVGKFGELGVRNKRLGQVIATSPQLLLRKPHEFLQVVSFLKDLGLDDEAIGRVLGRCPEIFATSIDGNCKKKLNFLASIGVYKSDLPQVIRKYPEFFVCDVDRALAPRMRYLVKTGLSRRDVASMVRRFSPLLGYSIEEVLRPKMEFLVNTMEKPLKDVVEYPRYFSYSLERKIKPRFWMLKGRNVECSLKDMLGKNDEEFASEFMDVGRMLVHPGPSSSMKDI